MNHGPASDYGLEQHGIEHVESAYWNLTTSALYEESVRRHEGLISAEGPLVVRTGQHTGRSANDKFVIKEPSSEKHVWWGKVNRPFEAGSYDLIRGRMLAYLRGREVFVQDVFVGADPEYRVPIRVITENAWHSIFARNMFLVPKSDELAKHQPRFTVIDLPRFHAVPDEDKTNSETFILLNFARNEVLIGGTSYAGEIKKSIFTILNYLLPLQGVLSMHCSANIGDDGDVAIFFGLSGTGKTTLSADPERRLIGDDEHGWSDARRIQLRRRMLRQGDQALPRSRAGDLSDHSHASARSSRTSSSILPRGPSTWTTNRSRRILAAPIRSRRSPTPSSPVRAGTRRTSSCSPLTPSASCRRSRS